MRIALGVSGGIAAYKACEIVRGLDREGAEVQVLMTRNATRFVTPLALQTLSRRTVLLEPFDLATAETVHHIDLSRDLAALVVAPATANVLAKFAHGIADDLLTTFYTAVTAPVVLAPAMNTRMWLHPATQENVATLADRGNRIVEPGTGWLAEGEVGWGRLADPETIVREAIAAARRSGELGGKTVLVTAGPTREAVDPVRFLSNRSSGRMGYAIAQEARRRGAQRRARERSGRDRAAVRGRGRARRDLRADARSGPRRPPRCPRALHGRPRSPTTSPRRRASKIKKIGRAARPRARGGPGHPGRGGCRSRDDDSGRLRRGDRGRRGARPRQAPSQGARLHRRERRRVARARHRVGPERGHDPRPHGRGGLRRARVEDRRSPTRSSIGCSGAGYRNERPRGRAGSGARQALAGWIGYLRDIGVRDLRDLRSGSSDPADALRAIRLDLGECTRCRLHAGRTNLVFGVGEPAGEADVRGRRAGRRRGRAAASRSSAAPGRSSTR